MSESLSMAVLTRAWQILLKGIAEIKYSQSPAKALDMLLIRLAYAAELPTPIELLKKEDETDTAQKKTEKLRELPSSVPQETVQPKVEVPISSDTQPSASNPNPSQNIQTISDIVALAQKDKEMLLYFNIANYVHPIELSFGKLKFSEVEGIPTNLCQELRVYLKKKTGIDWDIATVKGVAGGKTVKELATENKARIKENLSSAPLVQEVFKVFPSAQIETFNIHKEENMLFENEEGETE